MMWILMRIVVAVALGMVMGCSHGAGASKQAPATRAAMGAAASSWTGIAESRKVGPYLAGADVYVDFGGSEWPEGVEGKRVTVTGVAEERHDLPVFVPRAGEPGRAGIPVGEGEDLYEASRRVVIKVRTIKVEE